MSLKIVIPYLQIGEFRVETPVGLSELLEGAWTRSTKAKKDNDFASKYEYTDFRNEEGLIVTKCTLKGVETK